MPYDEDAQPAQENIAKLGMPQAVVDAIRERWPEQANEILASMRHSYDHYSFNRWGMYVGVEYDGYIHT